MSTSDQKKFNFLLFAQKELGTVSVSISHDIAMESTPSQVRFSLTESSDKGGLERLVAKVLEREPNAFELIRVNGFRFSEKKQRFVQANKASSELVSRILSILESKVAEAVQVPESSATLN